MDVVKLHPVFHVLLFLQAAVAHVEPPTDVTLQCHNLHNVLKWHYGEVSPGLKFRVTIGSKFELKGSPDELLVDPPAQQADLSFLSDPDQEYFLQVTAVIGDNESQPVPPDGIIFSYFKDSLVPQKCYVDLPSVKVTAEPESNIKFSFTHPWLLYHHKLSNSPNRKHRKKKSHDTLPEFMYNVVLNNKTDTSLKFICEESVCEETLPMDAPEEKHCLTITGELRKMAVKSTHLYCAQKIDDIPPTTKSHIYIYIVIGLLAVVLALGFVLFMVYRKNTTPSTLLPKLFSTPISGQKTLEQQKEVIDVAEVEPTTPTPLLSASEKVEFTSEVLRSDYDLRLPITGVTEDEGVCDVMEGEQPNNEGPGYMGGVSLDEDETEINDDPGYERREVLVELAPDDRAEGYRG